MSLGNQQAYPTNYAILNAADRVADAREYGYSEMGMTIRQRYAMAAMQALISANWTMGMFLSEEAFKQADSMIAFEERIYAGGKTETNEASEAGEELGDKTAQG